jgi:hypothetical protein
MNWDEVGAIGQVLGSIAVFITLGYLAVQVGHARGEMRRSISQNRSDTARQLSMFYASDDRMCHIIEKMVGTTSGPQRFPSMTALMTERGLTFEEAFRYNNIEMAWWQYRSQVIENVAELPSGKRIEFDSAIQIAYGKLPGPRLWYETSKATLNPDAVRYIDNLLAQPG